MQHFGEYISGTFDSWTLNRRCLLNTKLISSLNSWNEFICELRKHKGNEGVTIALAVIFISFVFPQFTIHLVHSFHWLMNSVNCSALHEWVFIVYSVEHFSSLVHNSTGPALNDPTTQRAPRSKRERQLVTRQPLQRERYATGSNPVKTPKIFFFFSDYFANATTTAMIASSFQSKFSLTNILRSVTLPLQ